MIGNCCSRRSLQCSYGINQGFDLDPLPPSILRQPSFYENAMGCWDIRPRLQRSFRWRIPHPMYTSTATILAVFNVLTDVKSLVMPMPILWKMHVETKENLQIMEMFLLGGLYATLITYYFNGGKSQNRRCLILQPLAYCNNS